MIREATPGGEVARRAPLRFCFDQRSKGVTRRLLSSLVATLVLIACGDSQSTIVHLDEPVDPVREAAEVVMVSGDEQEGEVASFLPGPLVVQVIDANGDPVAGVPIHWVFTQGGGAPKAEDPPSTRVEATSNEGGMASIQWQLGAEAGNQTASAELVAAATAGSDEEGSAAAFRWRRWFRARGWASQPHSIEISPEDPILTVGDSIPLAAEVRDRFGNRIQSAPVTWSSSDTDIAKTSASGVLHAMGAGATSVTAEADNAEGSVTVTATMPDNQLPIASITSPSEDVSVILGESVDFRGSAADADGSIASHAWTFGDGNAASNEDPGPYTYAATGTYSVTYRAIDDRGGSSPTARRTVNVTVPGNEPPTATITFPTEDMTIALGEPIDFEGSADDPDGTVQWHSWSFGDGNTTSEQNPGAYVFQEVGTYIVGYRVGDNQNSWSEIARRTITVEGAPSNQPPTASITSPSSNVTITLGQSVSFQGSASDPDGSIASHAWNFDDGNTSSAADPGSYTFDDIGVYDVTYRVTDNAGAQSMSATRRVTVEGASNQPPTASITSPSSNVTITLGQSVSFQGSASDPDGSIASHAWNFDDGSTSSAADPGSYTFDDAGVYDVTYRVTDDDGAQSGASTRRVTVQAPSNQPPTAAITSPSGNVTITLGQSVSFQGSASDPDGSIASHAWNFDDGNTSSAADPGSYTFDVIGVYDVTYRVTDDDGAQSIAATRTVTVSAVGPPPGGSVVAESDWGTGEPTDGGLWQHFGNGTGGFAVRSTQADGRNFPTPNYLRIGNAFAHMDLQGLPVPGSGESLCGQMYFRSLLTSNDDTHGFYFDGNGPSSPNWGPALFGFYLWPGASSYDLFASLGDWSLTPPRYFFGGSLQTGTTYRLDWCIRRLSATDGRAELRVSHVNGTLLYDEFSGDHWIHRVGDVLLRDVVFSASEDRWQSLSGWRIGLESQQSGGGSVSSEIARVRFCTDWCPN